MSLVADYGSSDSESDTEVPNISQDVPSTKASLFSMLPKPKNSEQSSETKSTSNPSVPQAKPQKRKIVVEVPVEETADTSQTTEAKRPKVDAGKSKSGLFAFLPAPKNQPSVATPSAESPKEDNNTEKEDEQQARLDSNASAPTKSATKTHNLVPYALTKKKQAKSKSHNVLQEKEEEEMDFFALEQPKPSEITGKATGGETEEPKPVMTLEPTLVQDDVPVHPSTFYSAAYSGVSVGTADDYYAQYYAQQQQCYYPDPSHASTATTTSSSVSQQLDPNLVKHLGKSAKHLASLQDLPTISASAQLQLTEKDRQYAKELESMPTPNYAAAARFQVSGDQKRTHNIMWLAQQSKLKEQELSAKYASERSKRKAHSKAYGF